MPKLKRLPVSPESLSVDSEHLYALLNESKDLAVIVVGVSYIDACLASLLARRLLKSSVTDSLLNSSSGAIGSFAARSNLAYALALIDKSMYQDLQVLAELRNETAHHHFELGFTSPKVAEHCQRLSYVANLKDGGTGEQLLDQSLIATPRNRFTLTATMIVNRLLLTALGTNHAERQA